MNPNDEMLKMEKLATDSKMTRVNSAECKEWKDRETRRWNALFSELRAKKERERHEALLHQRDAMNRAFRGQLSKMAAERDELQKKVKFMETRTDCTPKPTVCNEIQKLACENAILKNEKKKLEDNIQALRESEQKHSADLRQALEEKNAEIAHLKRQSRQEVTRLLEESRAKDRVISSMETEIRAQTCRAEQFRDILERSLLPKTQRQVSNEAEDLNCRQRKLQLQVSDLQEKMRQLQDNFSHEKRELIRRLKESEEQHAPLRAKSKQYLLRNLQLSAENRRLQQSTKHSSSSSTSKEKTNLKRSLTRPNLNSIDSEAKNDKQRRVEYVKQVQKLRKEQRYYSMWELPPLLEVDTDSAAEASDYSAGSLSPGTSSGIPSSTCCSDSWSEETRRELEMLFAQLSREHADLQRSYQVLHDRLNRLVSGTDCDFDAKNYGKLQSDYQAAKARISELEEMLQLQQTNAERPRCKIPSLLEVQAKFVREKHALQARLNLLSQQSAEADVRCAELQAEANELRDQNELLEFRILELEECQEKASSRCSTPRDRKDVCTDTDSDDMSLVDSGVVSLNSFTCGSPPLSSPISQDGDYLTEKLQSLRAPLSTVISCTSNTSHKSTMLQIQALLEVCQNRLNSPKSRSESSATMEKVNNWELHLQESGIFDEELAICDASVQTESKFLKNVESQTINESQDAAVQADVTPAAVERIVEDRFVQTAEQLIPLTELRDLQRYYEEQIDILQKERHELRKTLQDERLATEKQLSDAEELEEQHLRLQQLLEEKEEQFQVAFKKYREFHDHEIELCRNSTRGDIAILKECLQMIWHEIKDVTYVPETCETSLMEFTQNVLSGVQFICAELPKLQIKVAHLSQLEHAFQTTLQQADGLVRDIELQHLERIRVLERSEQDLKKQLEFFQNQIQNSSSSSPENNESFTLSKELCGKFKEIEEENEVLSIKCRDIHEHCQKLQNRIEELEMVENALRQSIGETERRFSVREQRLKEELLNLKCELEKHHEAESKLENRLEKKQQQVEQLKQQLDEEENVIEALKNDVKLLESRLEKEDSAFKNELTKLRSHLNLSLSQLNELELLNCQLREQLCECRSKISDLEKHILEETTQKEKLREENSRLQNELQVQSQVKVKSLTDELREVNFAAETTLEDFEEISLSGTPTGSEQNCETFEEHVRVLESLECFLEKQEREAEDDSATNELNNQELELQLAELQMENESLRSSLQSTESQKNNVIRILLEQLRSKDENCGTAEEILEKVAASQMEEQSQKVTSPETIQQTTYSESKAPAKKEIQLPEEDPLLGVPTDFRVTRTVGKDGVVVAWTPPKDEAVAGYLICVNREESQRIRSAHRTKAVLCGLDLQTVLEICIYSLSVDGFVSPPVQTTYSGTLIKAAEPQEVPDQDSSVPREVVVQTFYTNSSVTVRSSRVATAVGSKIPVRCFVP